MEYKGIKGNWEVIEINISDFKQICVASDASKPVLAHIYLPEYKITDELKATANLMAESYELLKALQEMVSFAEFHGYTSSTEINNARKVLEKALT